MDAKQHIEEIRNEYASSPQRTLDSLSGAIDRLLKAFPRRGHFLMEFIQNADDAHSSIVKIEVGHTAITVINNGDPFSDKDVASICSVGRSSKTAEVYMGYLGVGFKSAFLISECPQIFSGAYRFRFDRASCPSPANMPWQIIPEWMPDKVDKEADPNASYTTTFILPLSSKIGEKLRQQIRDETKPDSLNVRVLLFLKSLKQIDIEEQVGGLKRKLIKSPNISPSSEYEVYVLGEYIADVLQQEGRWLVFRSGCQVPAEVKADSVTQDWERESVNSREVVAAFRLGEDDNLVEEEKGTAHIGVFSFLPLKEVPSGLRFMIQPR